MGILEASVWCLVVTVPGYLSVIYLIHICKNLLYCIILYCIVLYCIVLYCIVLYCIVLYCIVLCYIKYSIYIICIIDNTHIYC